MQYNQNMSTEGRRSEDEAMLRLYRENAGNKEEGVVQGTNTKAKSPKVTKPMPHLSNSSVDGLGIEIKGKTKEK